MIKEGVADLAGLSRKDGIELIERQNREAREALGRTSEAFLPGSYFFFSGESEAEGPIIEGPIDQMHRRQRTARSIRKGIHRFQDAKRETAEEWQVDCGPTRRVDEGITTK